MNSIFQPYLRRFIIVFFDDILVYSGSLEDHVHHFQTTFQVLLQNQFVLKFSKCLFAVSQVEYLGHVVSSQGVAPVTSKIDAIRQWPPPRSVKALRSFLGLAGFYRRFIRGYALIAAPLIQLTSVDPFQWTSEAQSAFDSLKQALSSAPVLALPNFDLPFTVETDASGVGMGAVLSQLGHPIAFFSKAFNPKLLRSSTYVRELFAITSAVKKWRQYLLGHHFTIVTDHRSLKELVNQVIQTPEQHTYLARLMASIIQSSTDQATVIRPQMLCLDYRNTTLHLLWFSRCLVLHSSRNSGRRLLATKNTNHSCSSSNPNQRLIGNILWHRT